MNLTQLALYSENNRIEAKRATGGFPQSVWETYSAFANTLGGIILLGVEERKDHSLRPASLPDAEGLAEAFWRLVNDARVVNRNILAKKQVEIVKVDGKKIVKITVPRASTHEKPVYIGATPFGGSYKRSGEGDYKCTKEEVETMLRNAALQTRDMRVLEEFSPADLCKRSVKGYRAAVEQAKPFLGVLDGTEEFLLRTGVLREANGRLCPTAAGLLLLGKGGAAARAFPALGLEYREEEALVYTGKNLYAFYTGVAARIGKGQTARVKKALCEGLTNCLANADYDGGKVVVSKHKEAFLFSNPGGFRMDVERAKRGGFPDPRNEEVVRLFRQMGVGGGAGSGIPLLYETWREQGYASPAFYEGEPPRITLILPRSKRGWQGNADEGILRELAVGYLTDRIHATGEELDSLLGDPSVLDTLLEEGIVVRTENGYKLKR